MTVVIEGQGTYTVNSDGTVTFDPVPAFFGTATPITYQAMDMLGRYVDAKIMPIVLEPPDDAKVFDQSTSTKPGVPEWLVPTTNGIPSRGATFVDATLRLRDEKTNSWILSVTTKDGKWDVIKGKVRFTPNMDFRGETTLPYSVQDTEGVVLQAMLVVVVSETPETPKTGMSPYGLLLASFTMLMIGLFLRRRTSVHA